MRDVTFSVRAGEILGIAGLVGSGRTELAQTIFGVTPATSGEILIDGKRVTVGSVREAIDQRIAYVPEDRAQHGLVRPQTIRENVSMAILDRITRRSVVDTAREKALAEDAIKRFAIRARGPGQVVAQLSGGKPAEGRHRQVAGDRSANPDPRRADARRRRRRQDRDPQAHEPARAPRLAIIMISSELPEVLGMSDRVLVMNGGRMTAVLDRADATPDAVGTAMMTGHAA